MVGATLDDGWPATLRWMLAQRAKHRWPNGSIIGWPNGSMIGCANGGPTCKKYRWPNSNMIGRANDGPTVGLWLAQCWVIVGLTLGYGWYNVGWWLTGNVAVNVGPTSKTPLAQRQHNWLAQRQHDWLCQRAKSIVGPTATWLVVPTVGQPLAYGWRNDGLLSVQRWVMVGATLDDGSLATLRWMLAQRAKHRWPNGSIIGWPNGSMIGCANGGPTCKKYRWLNSNMIGRANGGPTVSLWLAQWWVIVGLTLGYGWRNVGWWLTGNVAVNVGPTSKTPLAQQQHNWLRQRWANRWLMVGKWLACYLGR